MPGLTRLERESASVAVMTLDHPERRNALSIAMRDEIDAHFEALRNDTELKVLVVTGAGDVFCSGFDLGEFDRAATDSDFAEKLWASSDRYHRALAEFPLVAIAAVNGPAIAGGFDLAVLCDLRVVSTTTRFAHPEYAFGDVVYGPLHDLVGGALARELCLTGRPMFADEALRVGLAVAVVESAEVVHRSLELAEQVAVAPRDVLVRTKAKALARAGLVSGAGTLEM